MISFVLASLMLAATPRVAIVVHTTGFSDDDAKRVQDKVATEVTSTGAELWTLSRALEVKSECLVDRQCARDVLRAADASYLVWLEATRAGGQVQLESHLLDVDGKSIAQDESASRADEVIGNGSLLATSIGAPLRNAVAASKPKSAATTTNAATPAATTTTTTPTTTATTMPAATATTTTTTTKEKDADAISPMAIGGIATLGLGAVMVIGGGAVAMTELGVVENPSALGTARLDAANAASAMFVVAGVGAVAAGTGVVLLVLGL